MILCIGSQHLVLFLLDQSTIMFHKRISCLSYIKQGNELVGLVVSLLLYYFWVNTVNDSLYDAGMVVRYFYFLFQNRGVDCSFLVANLFRYYFFHPKGFLICLYLCDNNFRFQMGYTILNVPLLMG